MDGWRGIRNLRRTLAASSGLTLIETVVALGLLSLAVARIGNGMFHVVSVQLFWRDDVMTTRDLRHAGTWFAKDALNAEDVFDAGGVDRLTCEPTPPVSEVILSRTDLGGVTRTANYQVSGDTLVRGFGGVQNPLAEGVVDDTITFSLCGSLLTLVMTMNADRGTTETMSLRTYIRKLQ